MRAPGVVGGLRARGTGSGCDFGHLGSVARTKGKEAGPRGRGGRTGQRRGG